MSIFSDGVKTAFDVARSMGLLTSALCVYDTLRVRDSENRSYTTNESSDPVELVKYDFNTSHIDGDVIKKGDTRFLIQESELTKPSYKFFTISSEKWSIKNEEKDPSNSIRIFHVRLQNA